MTDPFAVLGIAPGASADEVRVAWRRAARTCSPERDPEAFERARAAYELVRDRAAFARTLLDAPPPELPPARAEAVAPVAADAARDLLRHLLATRRIDLEDIGG